MSPPLYMPCRTPDLLSDAISAFGEKDILSRGAGDEKCVARAAHRFSFVHPVSCGATSVKFRLVSLSTVADPFVLLELADLAIQFLSPPDDHRVVIQNEAVAVTPHPLLVSHDHVGFAQAHFGALAGEVVERYPDDFCAALDLLGTPLVNRQDVDGELDPVSHRLPGHHLRLHGKVVSAVFLHPQFILPFLATDRITSRFGIIGRIFWRGVGVAGIACVRHLDTRGDG